MRRAGGCLLGHITFPSAQIRFTQGWKPITFTISAKRLKRACCPYAQKRKRRDIWLRGCSVRDRCPRSLLIRHSCGKPQEFHQNGTSLRSGTALPPVSSTLAASVRFFPATGRGTLGTLGSGWPMAPVMVGVVRRRISSWRWWFSSMRLLVNWTYACMSAAFSISVVALPARRLACTA